MSEPRELVDHFFRHEFGQLAAVLTRSLGVRRLDLVEDVVQAALVQALETWSRRSRRPGWLALWESSRWRSVGTCRLAACC
jgi:predicted RNA polymerase sigma factor